MSVVVRTLEDRIRPPRTAQSPLTTQEYFINMGPQHPSTHGVLRLVVRLDGETVREVIPVPGYVHRGLEKIAENQTYRMIVHLTDRLDYLSALMNNWAHAMAVERALELEVTDRIQTIRTIVAELQRIQSHQLWWGVLGMDMGAFTPFLHGFRDREMITDIFEETMGARLTLTYIQPGGVMMDIHPNFVKRTKAFLADFKVKVQQYEDLLSGNMILQERLRDIGILSAERAVSLGTTGPVLRASGVPYDLRKVQPYGVYDKVDFDVVIGEKGDCWDRYWVRIEEMRQSMRIVEQLIDNIPEGETMLLKPAKPIKLPEGYHYSQVENARGVVGVFFVSQAKKDKPYRIHFRTPCFNNLWAVTELATGFRVADLVAILSTLDIVVPDIDR